MTSLAELGEIAKREKPPPMEVEGYRAGRISHALPTKDQVYLKEGKDARNRRAIRALGAGGGALLGASIAAGLGAKKGRRLRAAAHWPLDQGELTNKQIWQHSLGAGAGAGAMGALGQQANYASGDVRAYNKQTGVRRHPGMWKVRDWQEGDTR